MAVVKVQLGVRLLETITSALYEDPIILFREYVQNSVDAYTAAMRNPANAFVGFHTDITVDTAKRWITILDNGYGIPEDEFIGKMTRIGSGKGPANDQIGFRGIGRLSGMPFCSKLVFIDKPKGLAKSLRFSWNGDRFGELLNKEKDIDLDEAVGQITSKSEKAYKGSVDNHFFRVELQGYNDDIANLLADKAFKFKLRQMLPLRYSPDFSHQEEIKSKYEQVMGESLDKYSFAVTLDGAPLYKVYGDNHVLESGIQFWELNYPSEKKGVPGKNIGILWFTFNKVMKASQKDAPYGILVRSKNMLMGDNDALAVAVVRSKTEYVSTFRELAQTLRGVYGEMLINSPRLRDNARRDWFRLDSNSIALTRIIVDFMRRLWTYRYTASDFFGGKQEDKDKVIKAFTELTTQPPPQQFSFVHEVRKGEVFKFADVDIPHLPLVVRRFYERLAKCLRDDYFKPQNQMKMFYEIRSLVKRKLDK